MAIAELIARFWVSALMLAAITLLSIYSVVAVLRSKTSSCPEKRTEQERIRIWWLKIGTAIAVVLCWTGGLIAASDSPLVVNGAINWSLFNGDTRYGDTYYLTVSMLAVVVIGLPMLSTAFWLKLLRHNWSDGEAPSTSSYILNYSLWLALIWSKILIGW
jgi:heme A synthase